jgi:hypothetical protein
MKPVEVTARFDKQGRIHPLNFVWNGHSYQVTSVGRNWEDEAGFHVLVMAPVEKVYELVFAHSEGRWYLKQPCDSHLTV